MFCKLISLKRRTRADSGCRPMKSAIFVYPSISLSNCSRPDTPTNIYTYGHMPWLLDMYYIAFGLEGGCAIYDSCSNPPPQNSGCAICCLNNLKCYVVLCEHGSLADPNPAYRRLKGV